jgi:hypothetical protein
MKLYSLVETTREEDIVDQFKYKIETGSSGQNS